MRKISLVLGKINSYFVHFVVLHETKAGAFHCSQSCVSGTFLPGIFLIATGFITCENPYIAVALLTVAVGTRYASFHTLFQSNHWSLRSVIFFSDEAPFQQKLQETDNFCLYFQWIPVFWLHGESCGHCSTFCWVVVWNLQHSSNLTRIHGSVCHWKTHYSREYQFLRHQRNSKSFLFVQPQLERRPVFCVLFSKHKQNGRTCST